MFVFEKMDKGLTPPIEYMPGTANETIVAGEALVLSSGALTKCGAKVVPTYIAVGPVKDGIVPVQRVNRDMIWDTTLQAAGTSLVLGDKVTLHTDGLQVTATTSETSGETTTLVGVAEIVAFEGKAVGDHVRVRF